MSERVGGKRHLCKCGHPRVYSYAYDAFYCPECDEWLEPVCELHDCIFCLNRRTKPSDNKLCRAKTTTTL
jgi:hypothetical protein